MVGVLMSETPGRQAGLRVDFKSRREEKGEVKMNSNGYSLGNRKEMPLPLKGR